MAGSCVGLGVRINSANEVEAAVDRVQAWPYSGSAVTKSGTRVDPTTGLLWTPPDQIIKNAVTHGAGRVAIPNDTQTVTLTTLTLQMTASTDHDQVMFWFALTGGYQGYRMGHGNFWATYRIITTYDNDVAVTFSGWEEVGSHENATGAGTSAGSGSIADSFVGMAIRPGGTRFKVTATYEMRPLAFTSGPTNGFAWRPPWLTMMQLSIPQELP